MVSGLCCRLQLAANAKRSAIRELRRGAVWASRGESAKLLEPLRFARKTLHCKVAGLEFRNEQQSGKTKNVSKYFENIRKRFFCAWISAFASGHAAHSTRMRALQKKPAIRNSSVEAVRWRSSSREPLVGLARAILSSLPLLAAERCCS